MSRCDCLTAVKDKTVEVLKEQNATKKPIVRAEWADEVFSLSNLTPALGLKNDLKLTLEGRKTPVRFSVMHSYCPFCGVKFPGAETKENCNG